MKWIATRLGEPSTWAGLALIAQGFAQVAADPKNPSVWIAALGGMLAVIAPEKGGEHA